MNNSQYSADYVSLEDLNLAEMHRRLPPIIYLGILIAFGLPSNISVILVFLRRFRKSTYRTFIVTLAIIDSSACTLSMPFEIFEMVFQYTFYWISLCKTFRFLNTVIGAMSSFTVFGLSLDRYRRVCSPMNRQFTVTFGRLFCISGLLISILISTPVFWISGISHVQLKYNITGFDCGTEDTFKESILPLIHNLSLLICFVFNIISLLVIYIRIAICIFKQNKKRRQLQEFESTSNTPKCSVYVVHKNDTYSRRCISQVKKDGTKSSRNSEIKSPKITRIAFAVSSVYVLSYLPYLILNIWTNIKGSFVAEPGPFSSALLPIVTRSVFINNICNPVLYGFFDSRFRTSLRHMMCGCFTRGQ